jgi:hypothetical protein
MISVGAKDIDIGLSVNLRKFIREECMAGLCYVEHARMLTHKHVQMVVKGYITTLTTFVEQEN